MSSPVHAPPEPGLSSLLKGIVDDFGELIKQQVQFAQAEIKTDLRKTKEAAAALALGVGVSVLGGLFLCLMLVYLLNWLTELPLWGCFAIVGGLFLGCGVALILAGKKKFDSFNPLPDQTAGTLKENVQWITNSK